MYFMYVDESGDTGISKSPTRYFILSAMVIHESNWSNLLADLVVFRRHLRTTKGLKLREEIHAVQFINSPGQLSRIKRNDRLDILKQCIDWLAKHNQDLSIFTVIVDKRANQNRDIFEIAWERLIQRFENTLSHKNFLPKPNLVEKGIILPDNTNGQKLRTLLRRMRHFNVVPNTKTYYQSGSRSIPLQCIVEDPFMKDSADSLLHQMVDVVAYCARQVHEPNQYMKKKGGHLYYHRLLPVLNPHVSKNLPFYFIQV